MSKASKIFRGEFQSFSGENRRVLLIQYMTVGTQKSFYFMTSSRFCIGLNINCTKKDMGNTKYQLNKYGYPWQTTYSICFCKNFKNTQTNFTANSSMYIILKCSIATRCNNMNRNQRQEGSFLLQNIICTLFPPFFLSFKNEIQQIFFLKSDLGFLN